MNSLNTFNFFLKTKSNECIITNLAGLFKNALNIKINKINYHSISNVKFQGVSANLYLKKESLPNSTLKLSLSNNNKNTGYFNNEIHCKNIFILDNKSIIQKRIEERKFFHSLIDKKGNSDEILQNLEESNANVIKTSVHCNKENFLELQKNETIIKTNEKENNELNKLKQKTFSKSNSECLLKHLPNILCISRILTSPIIGYLIVNHKMKKACFLYAISGITDFFDGYLARKFNWTSKLGSVIDPLADKILMMISTISLSIGKLLPKYIAIAILGRDIFLLLGSIYLVVKKFIDTRSTLSQIKHFKMRVKPSYISKINTTLQIILLALTILSPGLSIIKYLQGVVFSTTMFSGMEYIINRNAIDISFDNINKNEK
ncbi:hypothetical protein BCR36DRAFT_409182 [Piromyces finnis]|uniref:CDP-diacylglycerol--glycerol-3-phosphate 3-phosphatidyltransferase n=1 Tax=Piromyces finnis TaxID=1754191 RepID=A0A1Y1VK11_9FUNG|nr:hypothetical protein BCR36DRAFT_409182 [Piromyces finnis]|eukprot:ORX57708.1 hypothetical protein BCR36DRAFT_409182 [Piromyces finnis]